MLLIKLDALHYCERRDCNKYEEIKKARKSRQFHIGRE